MDGKNNIDGTCASIVSISSLPSSSSITSFPVTKCPTAYCEGGETPQGPDLPEADRAFLAARSEAREARYQERTNRPRKTNVFGIALMQAGRKTAANVNLNNVSRLHPRPA